MKRIRKITVVTLVISMLASFLPMPVSKPVIAAESSETQKESGNYRYTVKTDGTVKITGFKGAKKYVSIPETIEGKKVTEIGQNAFRNNQDMVRLNIPKNVTAIDDEAFANCNYLTQLTLPDTLKKIGKYAFSVCNKLKGLTIPESVEEIGEGAFFSCYSLRSLVIKAHPVNLGSYIFANCTNLTSAEFEEEFKEIPEGMFFKCTKLSELYGEESFEKIGDRAFYNCDNLSFDELNSIKKVDDYALAYVGGISSITLLTGDIGEGAFCDINVDSLTLEDTVQTEDAFENATISKMILGSNVDSSIQKSIRTAYVFDFDVAADNPDLSEFEDSLYNKNKTELIKYHTKVIVYDPDGEGIGNAYPLDLPEGIKKIGSYACYRYTNGELVLPESIEEIDSNAFYKSSFEKVEIPDQIKTIEESTFSGNYNLKTVKLGTGVDTIQNNAFENCSDLKDFEGEENVDSIGKFAFSGCSQLDEFTISDNLDSLGEGAFDDTNIKTFHVSENQPNYREVNHSLVTKDGKKLVCIAAVNENEPLVFPEGITTLMPYSLSCSSVKITIPDGVTDIEEKAIQGLYGQEITLPDSIEKIGDKAIGYSFSKSSEPQLVRNNIIYSATMKDVAKKYAKDNDIAIATGETDVNEEHINLAGNETFKLQLPGTLEDRTYYSSTDNEIASVSDKGIVTAHKKGKTYITVSTGDRSWYADVTVTSDGKPYVSEYNLSSYAHPMDNEKAWTEAYMSENDIHEFSTEENPNTFLYSGEDYYKGMKALLEHGQEYVPKALSLYGENYKRFSQINKNLDYELSKYRLHTNTVFYSGIRTVKNFTGTSDSVADMKASIGKSGTYNCITSTSYDEGIASGFTYQQRGGTVLEIYIPKGYSKGAYISDYSAFGGEAEYLMASGFQYKILDAGVRTYEYAEGYMQSERFMKLLVIPEVEETKPDDITTPGTSTPPNKTNTTNTTNTTTPSATKKKTIQKTVNGVLYKVSGKKVVVVKGKTSLKKVSIPSTIKMKGKTYKVKTINANAFKNCKKLKTIKLGKNISSIGKNAFKNIQAKAVFKVNKKYYKKYKKLLTKKTGYKKTMKLKY